MRTENSCLLNLPIVSARAAKLSSVIPACCSRIDIAAIPLSLESLVRLKRSFQVLGD